jgi:Protein of unknown function (DUF742)
MEDDAHFNAGATGRLIRPYLMTGGRTEVDDDIRLETQLQTTARGHRRAHDFRWEAKRILELAERPTALVEISARADLPLGVTRVVVSDLIKEGVMAAQRPIEVISHHSHKSLLEKVLNGVRNI